MVGPRANDERSLRTPALLTRSYQRRVALSTGATDPFPLFRAHADMRLDRSATLPVTAWTADASNYWSLSLKLYDEDGTSLYVIPFSDSNATLDFDTKSLSVGRALVWPIVGTIGAPILRGQALYLNIAETGTASDLDIVFQLDALVGV